MSGPDPTEKKNGAMLWMLGIAAVIVIGATMQDRPITIAAGDDPQSISTPVTGLDAKRTPKYEQRTPEMRSRPVPLSEPPPRLSYNGWSVPQ
jgi:hypothetical protein